MELHEVRQDPVTGSVAVRRHVYDELPDAWAVMSPLTGGSYGPTSHVEGWPVMVAAE